MMWICAEIFSHMVWLKSNLNFCLPNMEYIYALKYYYCFNYIGRDYLFGAMFISFTVLLLSSDAKYKISFIESAEIIINSISEVNKLSDILRLIIISFYCLTAIHHFPCMHLFSIAKQLYENRKVCISSSMKRKKDFLATANYNVI